MSRPVRFTAFFRPVFKPNQPRREEEAGPELKLRVYLPLIVTRTGQISGDIADPLVEDPPGCGFVRKDGSYRPEPPRIAAAVRPGQGLDAAGDHFHGVRPVARKS